MNQSEHPESEAMAAEQVAAADPAAANETSSPLNAESEFGDASDTTLTEVIDTAEAKRALEAALLAASEPMGLNELKRLFEGQLGPDVIRNLLDELRGEWDDRSVELAIVASGYRFRVKPVYQKYLERLSSDKPLKYSRAVMETLAIIAYRQPVTRGDIEDIRGVAVSPHILKTLEDRGWIDEIGHRETVGRPVLFATTKHFLDDLNLRSLEELPPLHELQATLDMTQAGAALSVSEPMLTLPGVESAAAFESGENAAQPEAADAAQVEELAAIPSTAAAVGDNNQEQAS
jgi:segregation and condensation protein B